MNITGQRSVAKVQRSGPETQSPGSWLRSPDLGSRTSDPGLRLRRGFTLIELLVAMAILMIITLIVARIFQQASMSWETGLRRTEALMSGRAVANFMARELSRAVPDPSGAPFGISGTPMTFWVLDEATAATGAIYQVTYDKDDLAPGIVSIKLDYDHDTINAAGWPSYGIVSVEMTNSVIFQTGVYFHNRDRNRL